MGETETRRFADNGAGSGGLGLASRRLVVFDFDGTLANTIEGIVSTARTVLLEHGFTEEQMGDLRRVVGPPFPQAFVMVYGVSLEEAQAITERYREIYATLGPEAWPAYDGIADLLRTLHADGRLLAIASSKRQNLIERATTENGLADLFDLKLGKQADLTDSKDKIIGRALQHFDLGADDAVMVGDRCYDVEAAATCGIPCVGVHYGNTCEVSELVDAGACAIAESVDELGRILRS